MATVPTRTEIARYTVDGRVSLLADSLMRHIMGLPDAVQAERVAIGRCDVAEVVVHELHLADGSREHEFLLLPGVDPDNCD